VTRGQFTVRVKEELAALRPATPAERRALLAALLRFAATLHIGGGPEASGGPEAYRPEGSREPQRGAPVNRFTLVLAGGSGGVARLAFWLLHAGYGVRADFRVREAGALAPRARYEVVLAERVEQVLTDTGILDGAGRLSFGVSGGLVRSRDAAACFVRGAFLGRGSVSGPTREPHLEIGTPDERTAAALAAALHRLGLPARASVRGTDQHRVVVKGGEAIGRALLTMGAQSAYLAWEDGRIRREVRGEAVRLANADQANLRRSVAAAMAQVAAVERVVGQRGWERLPADLAAVAALRLAHPDASLAELGALLDPPRSKGAVLARLRRLASMAPAEAGGEEWPGTTQPGEDA
jgi:cell division protein WhiA